jgi:hypothetical protein
MKDGFIPSQFDCFSFLFFFFFSVVLGLELRAYILCHSTSPIWFLSENVLVLWK